MYSPELEKSLDQLDKLDNVFEKALGAMVILIMHALVKVVETTMDVVESNGKP